MSMTQWAENEVKLACKKENSDYGCSCYQSALKAYKSLMEDGHSGASFGMTKMILKRLLDELPLTPIEDVPENWSEVMDGEYQCTRMSSLFKHVEKDGRVWYSDNNRVVCIDVESTGNRFHCGQASRIIDEMFPILMPYCPSKAPAYIVHTVEASKDGIIYGRGILGVDCPTGEYIEIQRYFDYTPVKNIEVTKEEYDKIMERYSN